MAAVALMGDINNGRKRGRSPPDVEDECTPISKRIAVLTLDGSNMNCQSQQNTSLQQPELQHLGLGDFSGDYSRSNGGLQHPLVHQQPALGQGQQSISSAGLSYLSAIHPDQQNPMLSQHRALNNHQLVPNGDVFRGGNGDVSNVFPYSPNIQNSSYYAANEVLYYSYLARTQRHGRNLHSSFYNRD